MQKIILIDPSQKKKACILGCQKECWFHLIMERNVLTYLYSKQIHCLGKSKHTKLILITAMSVGGLGAWSGKEREEKQQFLNRHLTLIY